VIGSRAGGTPDIVEDGVNGLLVPPGDAGALAAAIESLLEDDALASRLGAAAAESAARWVATPAEYAESMVSLVQDASRA
jgi:glycosyltransferase involved in cell wall biosynthesis